jgi:Transcriptional regulator containing an amidase domain and an AraC-type DNA-binding HTH domain
VGEATRCSVCGRSGRSPEASLHIAFRADLPDLLHAAVRLRAANVVSARLLGAADRRTGRAWMDARCISLFSGLDVVREGRVEPFLDAPPTLSSAPVQWGGIALEIYTTPSVFISRHEHPEHFLHVVLRGTVKYEVNTRGRNLRFTSRPGTIFLLPRGTVDEVNWAGPTHRMAVAIHPRLLTNALDETTHDTDIELKEHWDLVDRHISALLQEMAADLEECSPAGTIYGESLANALAVYLLKRHTVRRFTPVVYKGGLPGYRLKRVLDYIANNLETNISLAQLAAVASMSPHYFSELFKQSTGRAPHHYVLCTESNARSNSFATPSAASSRQD